MILENDHELRKYVNFDVISKEKKSWHLMKE